VLSALDLSAAMLPWARTRLSIERRCGANALSPTPHVGLDAGIGGEAERNGLVPAPARKASCCGISPRIFAGQGGAY
jgi:hypothetical protein